MAHSPKLKVVVIGAGLGGLSAAAHLTKRGHDITIVSNVAGGMNGVLVDSATGEMTGAACWRADGSPAALAGGYANAEARFNPLV